MKFHPNEFLAAALREPGRLAGLAAGGEALADAADQHGIAGLLLHRAASEGIPLGALADQLRARAAARAAAAALQDRESLRMLACIRRAGIRHAVVKGLALAYAIYPQPWLRPRSDTDLLVDAVDLARVDALFRQEGYVVVPHVPGERFLQQRHYCESDRHDGFQHNWDIHWRLTASHVLGDAAVEPDVWTNLCRIEGLQGALAPAAPHALMIACVHRLAHHYDDPRLIWLWDIRLLLESMSPAEETLFARLAQRTHGLAAACGHSLVVARDVCGAVIPPVLAPLLDAANAPNPASSLWSLSHKRFHHVLADLRSMPRGLRLLAIREHLLPAPSYMRERYPSAPRALLPLLYPWRLVVGVPKWLSGR